MKILNCFFLLRGLELLVRIAGHDTVAFGRPLAPTWQWSSGSGFWPKPTRCRTELRQSEADRKFLVYPSTEFKMVHWKVAFARMQLQISVLRSSQRKLIKQLTLAIVLCGILATSDLIDLICSCGRNALASTGTAGAGFVTVC